MEKQGIIFNIQRFSLHDGNGIRTVVFMKGCPLSCKWCSNPESMHPKPQLLQWPDKCIGCQACLAACQAGALSWEDGVGVKIDRVLCTNCADCCEKCYADALVMSGSQMTADQVMDEVMRDMVFYNLSRGGLTLSGGEPLAQPELAAELLKKAKEGGISTAVETSGYASRKALELVDPYVGTYLFDVKHLDSKKHKECVGVDNADILSNLEWLTCKGRDVVIRVPVVPGFNDDRETLQDILDLAKKLGVKKVNFLPYHEYGRNKYSALGMEYRYSLNNRCVSLDLDQFEKTMEGLDYGEVMVNIGG